MNYLKENISVELYTNTSYEVAKQLTERYSTSFSMSSRMFDVAIRNHVYAIYGLVRVADEIVDTYRGPDAQQQLHELEKEVARAIITGFSTNLIVHAYATTAKQFGIDDTLIRPFFRKHGHRS